MPIDEKGLLSLEKQLAEIAKGLPDGDFDFSAIQDLRSYVRGRLKELAWDKYKSANAI